MKAFQTVGRFVKPTTRFIQLFGSRASKSIVSVTEEELQSLLRGEGIPAREPLENGYVILALHARTTIGLGILIRGIIHHQLRKSDLPILS